MCSSDLRADERNFNGKPWNAGGDARERGGHAGGRSRDRRTRASGDISVLPKRKQGDDDGDAEQINRRQEPERGEYSGEKNRAADDAGGGCGKH